MRCEELKDLVPLHLSDLLEPDEAAAVREHLDGGCPRCTAELAVARAMLDLLPYALPAERPSPMAKARLMAMVRRETAETAPPRLGPVAAPTPRPFSWAYAAAASVAGALVGATLTGMVVGRRHGVETAELRERLARQEAQIDRQSEEMASLRRQIREATESIQLVSSPGVSVIDLAGQPPLQDASARIFWDRRRAFWQVYAANLPPAGEGKTYQLWFITDKGKISAGTFDPADTGEAALRISVPPAAGVIAAAAVTDEPAGGSPQPTGTILLLGKV